MSNKHPRAELIKAWLEDTTQPVWYWDEDHWNPESCVGLVQDNDLNYAIGPKPTQPPARMCVLAGIEFPEPMRSAPERGTRYWVGEVNASEPYETRWYAEDDDIEFLAALRIQATREGAIAQGRAMLAALKQAVEGAR